MSRPNRNLGGHGIATRKGTGGARITDKQIRKIRALEDITGSGTRDLAGWTRQDASDFITVLEHRAGKRPVSRMERLRRSALDTTSKEASKGYR